MYVYVGIYVPFYEYISIYYVHIHTCLCIYIYIYIHKIFGCLSMSSLIYLGKHMNFNFIFIYYNTHEVHTVRSSNSSFTEHNWENKTLVFLE